MLTDAMGVCRARNSVSICSGVRGDSDSSRIRGQVCHRKTARGDKRADGQRSEPLNSLARCGESAPGLCSSPFASCCSPEPGHNGPA